MKKLLSLLVFATVSSASAQSLCLAVSPGQIGINHRVGILYAANFRARVACTRSTPTYIYWRGGAMCTGYNFYGRSAAGRPFACRVLAFGRR